MIDHACIHLRCASSRYGDTAACRAPDLPELYDELNTMHSPVETCPEYTVAGTLSHASTLVIKVMRLHGDNMGSEIAGMVDGSRFSRARIQDTVD